MMSHLFLAHDTREAAYRATYTLSLLRMERKDDVEQLA